MHTRDLDQLIEIAREFYGPFDIHVDGRSRNIDAVFEVERRASLSLVTLSHNAPVNIRAADPQGMFLFLQCARGGCSASQEGPIGEFHQGQTIPFSPGLDTRLWLDCGFLQKSIPISAEKLQTVCERWLGHSLDRPLQLALRPFSDNLQRVWERTLSYIWSLDDDRLQLADAARCALDEYLLTLLLHNHPHNHSEDILATETALGTRTIRRAERLMIDRAAEPITVSDVATMLCVSVRSLQAGFRLWRDTTPNAFLRQVRLQRAREELQRPGGATNVTEVALRYGFLHFGRFSAYYRAAFGEPPSSTLHRYRGAPANAPGRTCTTISARQDRVRSNS